jgi:hypothetical protein
VNYRKFMNLQIPDITMLRFVSSWYSLSHFSGVEWYKHQ